MTTNSKVSFVAGKDELGEFYHIAVAQECDPDNVRVRAEGSKLGEEFLKLVLCKNPTDDWSNFKKDHLRNTAKIIFEHYNLKVGRKIFKRILNKAKQENWQMPATLASIQNDERKILVWYRKQSAHGWDRNMSEQLLGDLVKMCNANGTKPIIVGDIPEEIELELNTIGTFWTDDFFAKDSLAKQLWTLNQLYENFGVISSIGMMSGALDGLPMICNKHAVFIARSANAKPRMAKVTLVVPEMDWLTHNWPRQRDITTLSQSCWHQLQDMIWGVDSANWSSQQT